jgi:hypothetical protein
MRTEELINALARDAKSVSPAVSSWLVLYLAAGSGVAVALFLMMLGPRQDFFDAIATPWYPLKIALVAAVVIAAFPLAETLARPGAYVPAKWMLLAVAGLGAAVLADILAFGVQSAPVRMVGQNSYACITTIPIFASAPLLATLAALRRAAPTNPTMAGLVAGILSGAIGGTLYGLYCPDDSPLFVAVWYTIAIFIVAIAGAVAGRFALRW